MYPAWLESYVMQMKIYTDSMFILDIMLVWIEVEADKCSLKPIFANDTQKLRYFFDLIFCLRILGYITNISIQEILTWQYFGMMRSAFL